MRYFGCADHVKHIHVHRYIKMADSRQGEAGRGPVEHVEAIDTVQLSPTFALTPNICAISDEHVIP